MTMPPEATEFYRRVREVSEGTPYVATETDVGFDVTIEVADARWLGLFQQAGLSKVYTHHVAVPEPGVYTVTDESREVEWVGGAPRVSATAQLVSGRVREIGARKVWAFDMQGRFGVQADYRFDSEEGRGLLTGVAEELGLRRRRGGAEQVGLVFGVIGGVGALAAVVAVLVTAALGKF